MYIRMLRMWLRRTATREKDRGIAVLTNARGDLKAYFDELTDDEMSAMARLLPNELGNMSPIDKAFIGLKILVRRPLLLTKRVISVLLSFGYSRAKFFGW